VEGESTHGRGAVLLMGPIYWDEAARPWRERRLDLDRAERVHAAVVYCMSERDGSCVVSLAQRDSRDGGGTAIAVPFRHALDLEPEARALWKAECGERGVTIGAAWGTVGAFCRPGSPWRDRWGELVRGGRIGLPVHRAQTPLGSDGVLDLDWPGRVGGGEPDCDVILVALAVPRAPLSPAGDIGAALVEDDGERERFYRNRLCGITTVRDDEIIREMRAMVV